MLFKGFKLIAMDYGIATIIVQCETLMRKPSSSLRKEFPQYVCGIMSKKLLKYNYFVIFYSCDTSYQHIYFT